jgi:hypothetical protein
VFGWGVAEIHATSRIKKPVLLPDLNLKFWSINEKHLFFLHITRNSKDFAATNSDAINIKNSDAINIKPCDDCRSGNVHYL